MQIVADEGVKIVFTSAGSPKKWTGWLHERGITAVSYTHLAVYQSQVVVGAGFIGLEMAENLHHAGVHVSVVEMGNQVMAPIDFSMAEMCIRDRAGTVSRHRTTTLHGYTE